MVYHTIGVYGTFGKKKKKKKKKKHKRCAKLANLADFAGHEACVGLDVTRTRSNARVDCSVHE